MKVRELWHRYYFEDGYSTWVRGMDEVELSHAVLRHGELVHIDDEWIEFEPQWDIRAANLTSPNTFMIET